MKKQAKIKYQLVLNQEVQMFNSALECCFLGAFYID